MARNRDVILPAIAVGLALISGPAGAQDVRRIDDRSLTRERHERAVHAVLEIEGQKVELVYRRETVPGGIFLTVTTGVRTSSTYRYLGQDNNVLRFSLNGEHVLTYSSTTGRFVVIPEELQYTRLHLEVTPMPERGILSAALLDNGQPR